MLPVEQLRHGEAERQGKPGGMRLVGIPPKCRTWQCSRRRTDVQPCWVAESRHLESAGAVFQIAQNVLMPY